MPREKELYRLNLERLDEKFPDKEVLKYADIAKYIGCSERFVKEHYKQYYRKELVGISKAVIARALS